MINITIQQANRLIDELNLPLDNVEIGQGKTITNSEDLVNCVIDKFIDMESRLAKVEGVTSGNKRIWVSFGSVHEHEIDGKKLDKDTIAVIKCQSYDHGRRLAWKLFGARFSRIYGVKGVDLSYFPKGLIEIN